MWQRGAKIKTRESVKDIKDLDKAEVAGERMNKASIRSKDTTKNRMDDGKVSPSEYAEDKIWYVAENVVSDTGQVIRKETDIFVAAADFSGAQKSLVHQPRQQYNQGILLTRLILCCQSVHDIGEQSHLLRVPPHDFHNLQFSIGYLLYHSNRLLNV